MRYLGGGAIIHKQLQNEGLQWLKAQQIPEAIRSEQIIQQLWMHDCSQLQQGKLNFEMLYKYMRVLFSSAPSFYNYSNFFKANRVTPQDSYQKYIISPQDFSNYYQPKLAVLDPESKQIIVEMANPYCNRQKVSTLLKHYLELGKDGRTPQGLLCLLTALEKATIRNFKDQFTDFICESIIRSLNLSAYVCDKRSLMVLVGALVKKYKKSSERIKQNLVKYRTVQLLRLNMNAITQEELPKVIQYIFDLRDESLVSEHLRLATLSSLLEVKITGYLKTEMLRQSILYEKRTKYSFFMRQVIQFYQFLPPKDDASVKALYDATCHIIYKPSYAYKPFFLYSFYIYFPYTGRNENGQYYRDLILEKIKVSKPSLSQIEQVKDWHHVKFCYSIISFAFYKFMEAVAFRYFQDYNYLLKCDLQVPQLDPLFWQNYKEHYKIFNSISILKHTIQHIYPQYYVQTPQCVATSIKPPAISDNELKLRISMALDKLSLRYKPEMEVCGRHVDFLLQGDVILQVDGDYHFNMHRMEYDEDTQFRNLHLILSGYRLILLNIFQYNENRYVQELSRLLAGKMKFMESSGAVLVI